MAGEGHGDGFSDTRTNEIPDGSSPEIVRDFSGTSRECACCSPGGREPFDGGAVTMEHPRADRLGGSLEPFGDQLLVDQNLSQCVSDRKHPALLVLGRAWIEADLARPEIHLPPLQGLDFAADPPSGDIRKTYQHAKSLGEMSHNGVKLVVLEEQALAPPGIHPCLAP